MSKLMAFRILPALLGLCLAAPAHAQTCTAGPLKELAGLDMTPVPGGGMSVPIVVNGVVKNFLVSTGAGASTLTQQAGTSLGLRSFYTDKTSLLDANGYAAHFYFNLKSVQVGALHGQDMDFMATPDRSFGQDSHLDGLLAPDITAFYDIEMDFEKSRFHIFSRNHCPGQVIYWPATDVAIVPIQLVYRAADMAKRTNGGYHVANLIDQLDPVDTTEIGADTQAALQGVDIRTTVMLDGKSFTANIDTGLATSTLNTATARAAYHVTEDSPGSEPATASAQGPLANVPETVVVNGVHAFRHTFNSLKMGDVTVNNPRFTVRPDTTGAHDPNNGPVTGSLISRVDDYPRPEITIGMDILTRFHLYFAFKEGKLYMTPIETAAAAKN